MARSLAPMARNSTKEMSTPTQTNIVVWNSTEDTSALWHATASYRSSTQLSQIAYAQGNSSSFANDGSSNNSDNSNDSKQYNNTTTTTTTTTNNNNNSINGDNNTDNKACVMWPTAEVTSRL